MHHDSPGRAETGSYRPLLRELTATIDAVVVPAGRPTDHLAYAVKLARELASPLIALCSGSARAEEVVSLHERFGVTAVDVVAVDLPPKYEHPLLKFDVDRVDGSPWGRTGDLSLKRNLGLLLARRMGWHAMLFLDDDIHHLRVRHLTAAAAALRDDTVVGFTVEDFPDNSVVRHANRICDPTQDTFVGGCAMLVNAARAVGFFPDVYNEDWFFLYDEVRARRVVATGTARQQRYDPFADPERAATEEVGDVLAEGVMDLAFRRRGLRDLGTRFWIRQLAAREQLINSIVGRLEDSPDPQVDSALAALKAAEVRRSLLSADECAEFTTRWRADQRQWRERVAATPRSTGLAAALAELDLVGCSHRD